LGSNTGRGSGRTPTNRLSYVTAKGYITSIIMMRMNDEYGRVRKKSVMAYFKWLPRNLFRKTEKCHSRVLSTYQGCSVIREWNIITAYW
jgi:hypothetical protein